MMISDDDYDDQRMIMMSDNDSDHSGSGVSGLRAGQQDHGGRRQGPSARGRAKVEHRKYFIVKRENISLQNKKSLQGQCAGSALAGVEDSHACCSHLQPLS